MNVFSGDLKCWGAWDTKPESQSRYTTGCYWRREAKKEEPFDNTVKGRERVIVNQTNIGSVPKATWKCLALSRARTGCLELNCRVHCILICVNDWKIRKSYLPCHCWIPLESFQVGTAYVLFGGVLPDEDYSRRHRKNNNNNNSNNKTHRTLSLSNQICTCIKWFLGTWPESSSDRPFLVLVRAVSEMPAQFTCLLPRARQPTPPPSLSLVPFGSFSYEVGIMIHIVIWVKETCPLLLLHPTPSRLSSSMVVSLTFPCPDFFFFFFFVNEGVAWKQKLIRSSLPSYT